MNNGREDLVVQVHGACVRDEAGGEQAGWCRPFEDLVLVPAGGEVLVPVWVEFFPDTPRGTPLDIVVDAFDPLDPSDVAARNHVILRVVYNAPRGLMEDCLAALEALAPVPSPGKGKNSNGLGNQIKEIASHIELDAVEWVDDSRLQPHPRGIQFVYGQSAVAVTQLLTLTESKHLPIQWKIQLNRCIQHLTDASRILLQTAIRDAGGNAEAEAVLQQGDTSRLAGQEAKAVRRYKNGHVTVLK